MLDLSRGEAAETERARQISGQLGEPLHAPCDSIVRIARGSGSGAGGAEQYVELGGDTRLLFVDAADAGFEPLAAAHLAGAFMGLAFALRTWADDEQGRHGKSDALPSPARS